MKERLDAREAIDLSPCKREGRYYVVETYVDGVDYCDAKTEAWIWSIGRRLSDGVILASTQADLYQNPAFECLWLR
jgi:hypothetical protein